MKRKLEDGGVEVVTESVQGPDVEWTQQDRQPGWEDLQPDQQQQAEDSDPDGDDYILASRRRQQRLVTPEAQTIGSGDEEPPGAPVKKKRRVLPWTKEGRKRWPIVSKYDVYPPHCTSYSKCDCVPRCVPGVDDGVVEVDDSAEESVDDDETETEEDGSEDDCSSFVVDDDSESLEEEESATEVSLGRGALLEVRAGILEKISKREREVLELKDELKSVDEELGELTSVDGESSEDDNKFEWGERKKWM